MRFTDRVRSFAALALVSLGAARASSGQALDTALQHRPAVVIGRVVDSSGAGVDSAEVMVLTDKKPVVEPTISDSQGNFRIRNLPAGGPYTFIARKLGYKPARGRGFTVHDGDTLRLRFVLEPIVVVLDPITVKGRRRHRSSLYASEFASKEKIYRDALSLITWYRPYMLGDPEFCSLPDEFGYPTRDRTRVRITDRLVLFGSSMGEHLADLTRKPWIDSLRFGSIFAKESIALPYVRQVYVNGLRVDRPNDPIYTPLRMLRAIPTSYIAEMHYVDCWNTSVPIGMRYSIFVTLKRLSPAQQDTVSRFVMAGAALAGPIEGTLLSIKRPNRETWDSLVRSLTGRDSTAADPAKAGTSP